MRYTGKQIVSRIKSHVRKRGGLPGKWFIGVSSVPRSTLFDSHSVRRQGDYWILIHATSSKVARKVKAFLAKRLGMAAETVTGEKMADFVYAYRKSAHTAP